MAEQQQSNVTQPVGPVAPVNIYDPGRNNPISKRNNSPHALSGGSSVGPIAPVRGKQPKR